MLYTFPWSLFPAHALAAATAPSSLSRSLPKVVRPNSMNGTQYETDKETIYMQSHRLQNGFAHAMVSIRQIECEYVCVCMCE